MKTPMLACCILLSGCSIFNASSGQRRDRKENHTAAQVREVRRLREEHHLGNAMEWHTDSMVYRLTIEAGGPYRIHPDSGVQGSDARITLQGSRRADYRQAHQSLSAGRSALHGSQQQSAHAQYTVREKETARTRLGIGYWWAGLVLAIVLLYRLWKRQRFT